MLNECFADAASEKNMKINYVFFSYYTNLEKLASEVEEN